jgi:PHP family Zn ribbon phosphoesterase
MMEKKCLTCGNDFISKSKKNDFCSRKCFVANFRLKAKIVNFPCHVCQNCGKKVKLKFQPKLDAKKWESFKCSACGFSKNKEIEDGIKEIEEAAKSYKKIYY